MIRQSFKDFLKEHGPFYAPIAICPLAYHGYKATRGNIDKVIEEIKYELSLFPNEADKLLDQINSLKAKYPSTNEE